MDSLLQALYNRTERTKNARFEAARRMERCDKFSIACIAFLSLEIIAINIFQLAAKGNNLDYYVSAATIILSAFALVMSLIVNQAQYSVKASRYVACALSLDDLCYEINRKLKSGSQVTIEELAKFDTKYVSIRKESNLNHEECDDKWAMRTNDKTKKSFGFENNPISYNVYRISLWFSHWIFSTYFLYLIITVIGALIVSEFMFMIIKGACS